MKTSILSLAAACVASFCSATFAAGPGDEAATAVPLSGNGIFHYDGNIYTDTQSNIFGSTCFPDNTVFYNDAFVCWTASCTGTVTISACGPAGAPAGTRIAVWDGCGTPSEVVPPICCDDNFCGQKDAEVRCQVICGHQYLVRIGLDSPQPVVVRDVTFTCDGAPCDTEPQCASCCARPPRVSGFQSPTLVGTSWEPADNKFVVHVFDASTYATQLPGPWPAIPVYEHPDWTRAKLGTVFGVTVDGDGNIYVAHSAIYQLDKTGTVGGGGAGAIYKLDSATGTPSLFCKLPNVETCAPAASCAPGLGNLTYSCAHDCIYCTNFEDGRIYRIAMNGTLLEAYNFTAAAIQTPVALATDVPGAVPYGQLTWAVGVSGDRLYFSVVNEDGSFVSAVKANEIWSIPLTPVTGAFAGANATLEITMPDFAPGWSNPVADLSFDADCCMFIAERSMSGPSSTSAHQSRLLKFCPGGPAGTGWTASADHFETGISGGLQDSCAGGVGVDFGTGGLVWATSDAMAFGPTYYGIIGLPTTGGVNANGLLVDMNGDTSNVDKTWVGSVEVTCKLVDVCTATGVATCHIGPDGLPDGTYDISLTIHNGLDGVPANFILLPDLGTYIPLVPPLAPGASTKVNINVPGQTPGTLTLAIGLFNSTGAECCGIPDVDIELPDCDCLLTEHLAATCHDDEDPTTYWYDVSFTLRNTSGFIARHLFIIPTGAGVTTTPQYVQLPFLAPGQTMPINFVLKFPGAPPVGPDGLWHTQVSLSMHNISLAICCKKIIEISGPVDCGTPLMGDLNHDGKVDGADLGIMLASWGVATAGSTPADINVDGKVDGVDLGTLLGNWQQ